MDQLDEVMEEYATGNFTTALEKALPLANEGLKEAQAFVGSLYHLGLGTEIDPTQAVYWYEKAVEQGESSACNNLAWIYELGLIGIERDLEKSKILRQKAIDGKLFKF